MTLKAARLAMVLLLAILIGLSIKLRYLWPYTSRIFHAYWIPITVWAAALYANFFAAGMFIFQRIDMLEAGKKLKHVDAELRSGFSGPVVQ